MRGPIITSPAGVMGKSMLFTYSAGGSTPAGRCCRSGGPGSAPSCRRTIFTGSLSGMVVAPDLGGVTIFVTERCTMVVANLPLTTSMTFNWTVQDRTPNHGVITTIGDSLQQYNPNL
eukprot:4728041-Amphidinium_carterae.1